MVTQALALVPVLVLEPTQLHAMVAFPDYFTGIWYVQPLVAAAYRPSTLWFCTTLLQPYPIVLNCVSNPPMYRLVNEEIVEPTNHKRSSKKNNGGWAVPRPIFPFPLTLEEAERSGITTIMIRNIPNKYQPKTLLSMLDDHCMKLNKTADRAVWSEFDFMYLLVDFCKHAKKGKIRNLGYAFVNFTTVSAAFKFFQQWHGFVWSSEKGKTKKCEISIAECQGKVEIMREFRERVFRCKSPTLLPVVFPEARNGFNRDIEGTTLGTYVDFMP